MPRVDPHRVPDLPVADEVRDHVDEMLSDLRAVALTDNGRGRPEGGLSLVSCQVPG